MTFMGSNEYETSDSSTGVATLSEECEDGYTDTQYPCQLVLSTVLYLFRPIYSPPTLPLKCLVTRLVMHAVDARKLRSKTGCFTVTHVCSL
jgi:hypothetical protein